LQVFSVPKINKKINEQAMSNFGEGVLRISRRLAIIPVCDAAMSRE
jgi:hypothetical protein